MRIIKFVWLAVMATSITVILLYFYLGANIRISIKFTMQPKESKFTSIINSMKLKKTPIPQPILNIKKFQRKMHQSTTDEPSTSTQASTTQTTVTSSSPATSTQIPVTKKTNTQIPKPSENLSSNGQQVLMKKISADEKKLLMDLLGQFVKLAERLNLTYFMEGGTLLGSWRHHGMIPWDDDVDILVNETQKPQLLAEIKKLEPNYFGPDTKPVIKFYSKESKNIPGRKWRWPFIDICFFKDDGKVLWDTIRYFSGIKYSLEKLYPLHKRPFETFELNAPRDSLYVIQTTYKSTYSYCTTWSYSHVKETGGFKSHSVSCERLKEFVPFVHRRYLNGTMEEQLRLGSNVIHTKYVPEERSSLSKPYDLKRI